jgi:hypothetical protein
MAEHEKWNNNSHFIGQLPTSVKMKRSYEWRGDNETKGAFLATPTNPEIFGFADSLEPHRFTDT